MYKRGKGYATNALRLIIEFGFETLDINRLQARHFMTNPASERVMKKAGMVYEGTSRQAFYHQEVYKDSVLYAILKEDYDAPNT